MSTFIEAFDNEIKKSGLNIFRFAEIIGENDAEVIDYVNTNPCQDIYSVAKAFTVTAIGMLVDRGVLSVDEKIGDILSEEINNETCNPLWKTTSLDVVMRHRLGLPAGFLDIDAGNSNTFGKDFLNYTLKQPLRADHGTEHSYTDAAYYIASRVVAKRAGMPLDEFMWREFFPELGVKEAAWSKCPQGHAIGATGLYIRVDDMAKLGALYLNNGVWHGKRILSDKWVETVKSRGYEFGFIDGKAYGKGGMAGQMLMFMPEQNRCVAWQGFDGRSVWGLIRFVAGYKD